MRHLTGQNKAFLARYDYAPYGELMRNAGLPLTVGHTGHRWDAAIGQYFAPFRYYNPQTARWNMRDPLGFVDGPNMYAYVAGNPVNSIDYSGLASCPPGWQNYGNVFVGPQHPAYGPVDAHWHVRIPGSPHELRVNAQGIIQKGKYKGQLLRNQFGWRGAVRTLLESA